MPSTTEIKSQLTNALPPELHDDISHFVDTATQPSNAGMTTEQLLNFLVADPRIANLLSQITQQNQSGGVSLGSGNTIGQMADAVAGNKIINNYTIDIKTLFDSLRSLNGNPPTEDPVSQPDPTIEQYKQQFVVALGKLSTPKYAFPLTFRLISETGTPVEGCTGIPIDQLIARVKASRMIILRGAAGSGKSTIMQHTAQLLGQSTYANIVPLYLQLRALSPDASQNFSDDLSDNGDAEHYLEPLLASSIVPISIADLKQLGDRVLALPGGMLLVMADGLNEIYGEDAASSILKRLTTYVTRRGFGACVLVTDRLTPRDAMQWQLARIERLTVDVIFSQFRAKQIDTIYKDLNDNDRSLLQTPYFLVYALEHNTSRLGSAAEAIAAFFEDLGFSNEALNRIAKAAFEAYQEHHNSKFDVLPFAQAVDLATYDRLVDEGVVVGLSAEDAPQIESATPGEQVQFDHPLKHDYLAARYLAQHEEMWTPWALDVVSFESNSFDALAMTLEMLTDEAQSDTFIERVHNWNWAAALICIAKAMRTGSGRHSQEIQFAVLALVAEKMFDAVQQIRTRANEVLSLFPQAIAAPYMHVRNLNELYALVQQQVQAETKYKDREPWFPKWRDLFGRFDGLPFSEQDLKKIVDPQAIIGWTAANVFRRVKLSEIDVRQLRAYYDACIACGERDWQASTIRSRVVHALGATDTGEVVDLLFETIGNDNYLWSKIGATRSLVEIAALTADAELRRRVIDTLIDQVNHADSQTLADRTLREIGASAFYRGAHEGWQQAVTPLITRVRDLQQSEPEKESWSNLLSEFEKFCQPTATLAVGASTTTPAPATGPQ